MHARINKQDLFDNQRLAMSKPVEDILSESEGSEGWDDVNEGDDELESLEIVSLFDEKVFPDAQSMLAHCKDKHNFDFVATRDCLGLDFYNSIKLVNFGQCHVPRQARGLSLS